MALPTSKAQQEAPVAAPRRFARPGAVDACARANPESLVDLNLRDAGRIELGRIAGGTIRVTGTCVVGVGYVEGATLDVEVADAGVIRVAGGDIERLRGRITGSGRIDFAGSADEAELVVHGSGQISILRVRYSLARSCVGSGNVVVVHPPSPAADRSRIGPRHADPRRRVPH